MKKIRSVVPTVLVSVPVLLGVVALASCGSYPFPTASGETGSGETVCATPGGAPAGTGITCPAGASPSTTGSLPCDIFESACQPCVSAHSTVRLLRTAYTGPLYQVQRASDNTTKDIGVVGGYADAALQDSFCASTSCTIPTIYDQSAQKNDLTLAPPGGEKGTPGLPAKATDLKISINGHSAYGIRIRPGIGYRKPIGNGTAKGDDPQTVYMVSSQKDLIDGCCFDYGNAETDSHDDGNGTMEAVYVGAGVIWGTGTGSDNGPWVMADLGKWSIRRLGEQARQEYFDQYAATLRLYHGGGRR